MENIELIVFDLDDTLVDSEKVYYKGWSHVLKGYGHHVDESEFEMMRGRSTEHNNQIIKSYLGPMNWCKKPEIYVKSIILLPWTIMNWN